MRFMPALACALALPLMPGGANADCTAEIAALFDGGPLDPFARPNRREVTLNRAADGSETPHSDVLWDGVERSINCMAHGCTMIIGQEAWMGGTSHDGPWTQAPTQMPDDPADFARITRDDMAANVTEAECLGEIETDAGPRLVYRFRTRTNPNEFDAWFGAFYEVQIIPGENLVAQIELSEEVAHWAPEPSSDVKTTTVTYDDSISIVKPEG